MQKGSLIELNPEFVFSAGDIQVATTYGIELPEKGITYVCRDLFSCEDGIDGVYLEEIVNPNYPGSDLEWGYAADIFVEVQPPMEINLEEMIALENSI